jgi:hypothetical protein
LSGGVAYLILFLGTPPPGWTTLIYGQATLGSVLLLGAVASWLLPPLIRPYLLVVGAALIGVVVWYPTFMYRGLVQFRESGVKRFGHAPGVLALGLAFAFRLLLDFGPFEERTRRALARPVGMAGLAIGGCLDALVFYWVINTFLRA